jgi:hypothetical protein
MVEQQTTGSDGCVKENGVMIDVASLALPEELSAADFELSVGNGTSWSAAPAPTIAVRRGAGIFGSDRITLIFPDGVVWEVVRRLEGRRERGPDGSLQVRVSPYDARLKTSW